MSAPRTLISGGTGFVGRFIVEALLRAGHRVTVMGRRQPSAGFFSAKVGFAEGALDPDRDHQAAFEGIDNLVHAAFDHLPGRYRGGEGGDPDSFRRRNVGGSAALFEAARAQGVERTVYLSSRAVYGEQPAGMVLTEETAPHPDTLYGEVKLAGEALLDASCGDGPVGASLRLTGVYGPAGGGREHKWSALVRDYLAGLPIAPRAGTEVHGEDAAAAVLLILEARAETVARQAFNVSDIVVDRREVLGAVQQQTGSAFALPLPGDVSTLNIMATAKIEALGWKPGGWPLFEQTMRTIAVANA